jgi:hypothetical protein
VNVNVDFFNVGVRTNIDMKRNQVRLENLGAALPHYLRYDNPYHFIGLWLNDRVLKLNRKL